MRAIILAAGRGTRLGSLTDERPKCLVEVKKRSILENELIALDNCGVKEVIIVVGYRKDDIHARIGDRFGRINITYIENPYFESTNNVYSLWIAREYLQKGCILIEGDIIFEEDIIRLLLKTDASLSFWVVDKFTHGMSGCMLQTDNNAKVNNIHIIRSESEQIPQNAYKSVGILKISPKFGELFGRWLDKCILEGRTNIYYDNCLADHVSTDQPIYIVKVGDLRWFEVDTPEDLTQAEKIFST